MRSLRIVFVLAVTCFLSLGQLNAQTSNKKAKKLYEQGSYLIEARKFKEGIETLEASIALDPNYMDALIRLGNAYKTMNMHNMHIADIKRVYSQVATLSPDNAQLVTVYYDLADIYMKEGSYSVAKNYLDVIKKYPDVNKRVSLNAGYLAAKVDFAIEGIKNPLDFNPIQLPDETVNRYAFNSHPVLTADQKTMIISTRNAFGNIDENVMYCEFKDGKWNESKSISSAINTPRNEGMATISGDGRTLVFTSCYREDSKGGCDLYVSYKVGELWSEPKNMGYNINSTHKDSEATVSADGRTLYFSSDRNPGWGLDLYSSTRDEKGEWQEAKNLGPTINTKFHETTPFIHADGQHLYFASDGHLGFGGFDNFVSEIKNGELSIPQNLGYPLNSSDNEGSLYISPDYTKGYFEKYEKKGSESRSLIYEFEFPEKIRGKFLVKYVEGRVFDAVTKLPLSASLELTNIGSDTRNQLLTSDEVTGKYLVVLKEGEEYALHVEKSGYLYHSQNFNFNDKQKFDPISLDVYLEPIKKDGHMVLTNLFYETDKFELNAKSKTELMKLVDLLEKNPTMSIEIEGHTDNQGNLAYNKTLSTNRAKSVVEFLVSKGISVSRLKYQGYASLKPKATNDTEAGRLLNRRIEIRVL